MSIGPVTGEGIAINLPVGKVVFWSATAQAANKQFVQLRDEGGNTVFTAEGASSDGHSPAQIGQGFFQVGGSTGNFTVWLGTNGGAQWSNVLWTQDVLAGASTIYMGKYVFTTEDAGDADYNDTFLQMQWFQFVG